MESASVEQLKDRCDRLEAQYFNERDKLVQAALLYVSDKFNTDEAGPGWEEDELHEEMLSDQIEKADSARRMFLVAEDNYKKAVWNDK